MRHSNSGKKLGRTPSHRKALFRNMASAMITYGKIRTTEVKAKELRRVVEPLITLALRNDLHSRVFSTWSLPCSPASPAATPGSPRWRFPVRATALPWQSLNSPASLKLRLKRTKSGLTPGPLRRND